MDVASGRATNIPFTARIRQTITNAVRTPQRVAPDSFDVKMLRWVTVSPDQRRVVYTSLGKLWVKDLPNGTPRRVTSDARNSELFPSWSPDGRTLVYASWDEDSLGAIRVVGLDDRRGRKITTRLGHYVEPKFSDNGQQIVFRRVGGDDLRSRFYADDRGIYTVAATGGEPKFVTEDGTGRASTRRATGSTSVRRKHKRRRSQRDVTAATARPPALRERYRVRALA